MSGGHVRIKMSILSSVSNAVTGLNAQSKNLNNISDNLANSSTTAYKASRTYFEDLVSTDSASASTGSGTMATTNYYNGVQGSIVAANSETYLAISGEGYFAVTTGEVSASGSVTFSDQVYYTRAGDFSVSAEGYLQNSEGYYLMGWPVDAVTGTVNENTLTPIQISELTDTSVTTSELVYDANLPATANTGATTADSTVEIYDSAGEAHDVVYSWTKLGSNTWELTITAPDGAYNSGTATPADYTAALTFIFGEDGSVQLIDAGTSGATVSGTSIAFTLAYDGAAAQTISADFDALTQFADDTLDVASFAQDGVAAGAYGGISINKNGFVYVDYDNGVSRAYYEIPLATFNSENNLERISGNAYGMTLLSGDVTYSAAGTGGAGVLSVAALESSTVDIAEEFTIMIQAQQAYSANSKVVSVADKMLETLITV